MVRYNAAAGQLMASAGVEVNDLYKIVKSRAEELLSDGVHLNQRGQSVLAENVAAAILITLDHHSREADLDALPSIARGLNPELRVFLLMGQSNMVGRGELTRLPTDSRVLVFNQEEQWQVAQDPLHETSLRDRVGPGVSFACGLLRVLQPLASIGLVPCAVGGSPLSRWEKGGDLNAATIRRAAQATEYGSLTGVLWLQGEADAKQLATARTYAQRLETMISDLRQDLQHPDLPWGKYSPKGWKDSKKPSENGNRPPLRRILTKPR